MYKNPVNNGMFTISTGDRQIASMKSITGSKKGTCSSAVRLTSSFSAAWKNQRMVRLGGLGPGGFGF